ncbi:MAG: Hsp20/alpha crystallin family protein [Desulfobulbaceae bacterium]
MPFIRFIDRPGIPNPWAEFERIRQGMDRLSRGFLTGEKLQERGTVFPALNVYEDEEGITIRAELPGVKAAHLDISIEGDTLTIKGRREATATGSDISFHRREIETGSFSRAIGLPRQTDPDSITARLHNGILDIRMKKSAHAKPRRVNVVTG